MQHEFGNQPVGSHKRISAGKFVSKIESEEKARKFSHDLQPRRRLNSELSESILTPDSIHHHNLHHGNQQQQHSNKHLTITSIYAPAVHTNGSSKDDTGSGPGQNKKIVAPPASLTSDMMDRRPSANSEVQMVMTTIVTFMSQQTINGIFRRFPQSGMPC